MPSFFNDNINHRMRKYRIDEYMKYSIICSDKFRDNKELYSYPKQPVQVTLRRPKQHGPQAPDVPDLAQTVKNLK